jgi:hypothetical protein
MMSVREEGMDSYAGFPSSPSSSPFSPVRKQVRNGMLSPAQFERQQVLKAEGV